MTRSSAPVRRRIALGNGIDPATTMGPLTTRRQLDRIEKLSADTVASGEKRLTGGPRRRQAIHDYLNLKLSHFMPG